MYETWHLLAMYAVGTGSGLILFRHFIKEHIITATIDTLVEQEYVRSYEDDYGMTHLYKWHELEDIIEKMREETRDYEEDDTP
jgi:hypothetical protein